MRLSQLGSSLRVHACHTELTKGENWADFKNRLIVHYMIYCLNHNTFRIKMSTIIDKMYIQLTKVN